MDSVRKDDLEVSPVSRAAVGLLVATAVVVLAQLYAGIPLIAPLGREFGESVAFAMSTTFGLCYALGFVVWGALGDHFGYRRILIVGTMLLLVATGLCCLATSTVTLGVFRAAQGFIAASFAPASLAYLSQFLPASRRQTAIGAMSTAFLAAGIVGQVGAQAIVAAGSWRAFFVVTSGLLAIAICGIVLLVQRQPRTHTDVGLFNRFTTIAGLAVRPSIVWLWIAHFTLFLSFVALYTGLTNQAQVIGVSDFQTLLIRAAGLPGMFVALAAGPLSKRFGMHRTAMTGFLVASLGALLVAVLASMPLGVTVGSAVFVAGIALAASGMISLFAQAAGTQAGAGMALQGLVLFSGASVGPLLSGLFSSYATLLFTIAGLLGAAASSVALSLRVGTASPR